LPIQVIYVIFPIRKCSEITKYHSSRGLFSAFFFPFRLFLCPLPPFPFPCLFLPPWRSFPFPRAGQQKTPTFLPGSHTPRCVALDHFLAIAHGPDAPRRRPPLLPWHLFVPPPPACSPVLTVYTEFPPQCPRQRGNCADMYQAYTDGVLSYATQLKFGRRLSSQAERLKALEAGSGMQGYEGSSSSLQ